MSTYELCIAGDYIPIKQQKHTEYDDIYTDKAGGLPQWLITLSPPTSQITCSICNSSLLLLCQLYTPITLDEIAYDRIIYIFICNRTTCKNQLGR